MGAANWNVTFKFQVPPRQSLRPRWRSESWFRQAGPGRAQLALKPGPADSGGVGGPAGRSGAPDARAARASGRRR